jgi:hypothetical protein
LTGSELAGKQNDPGFDLFQNSLISGGVFAIGIFNIPIFHIDAVCEKQVAELAGQIDDEVGVVHGFEADRLGREAIGRIPVGEKCLLCELNDASKGMEAGAGGFDEVRSVATGNGFCHGAAASVADADEEDTEFLRERHREIVARGKGNPRAVWGFLLRRSAV